MAPSYLYFGCRNEAKDFYYREFWEQCQRDGILASPGGLVTAFSRDQQAKVYVQQRICETSAQLWAALEKVRLCVYRAKFLNRTVARFLPAKQNPLC